jgi:hypothetical protein
LGDKRNDIARGCKQGNNAGTERDEEKLVQTYLQRRL